MWDQRGCNVSLRPRGRAAHGPREAQVARTCGRRPRGSTQMPMRGATWRGGWRVKGPRVSGPWLEYWGGNAIALNHPTLYTDGFAFLSPCGTMFPHVSSVHDMWRHRGFQRRSRGVDRVDPSPRDRDQDMCVKSSLSHDNQKTHLPTRGRTGSVRFSSNARS